MRYLFICTLLLGLLSVGRGQQATLLPVVQKGQWGYINGKGKLLMPPQFSYAESFNHKGYAIAAKGGQYGVIDTNGQPIIAFHYRYIEQLQDSLFSVSTTSGSGAIWLNGDTLLPPEYQSIEQSWMLNHLLVEQADKWGVYIIGRGLVVEPLFDRLQPNIFNYSVFKGLKEGIYSWSGRMLIPAQYDEIIAAADGGYRLTRNGKVGMADTTHRYYIPPLWTDVYYMEDSLYAVRDSLYGLYDLKADQMLLGTHYEEINIMKSGKYRVRKGGMFGIVDKGNKWLLEAAYSKVSYLAQNNSYRIIQKGKFGIANRKGQVIIPCKYSRIQPYQGDYIIYKDGLMGLADSFGTILVPPLYNKIWAASRGHFRVKKDGKWGMVATGGDTLVPLLYDNLQVPVNNIVKVTKDWCWGLVVLGTDTQMLVPNNNIIKLNGTTYKAYRDHDMDIIKVNNSGETLAKSTYEDVAFVKVQTTHEEYMSEPYINANGTFLMPKYEWFYDESLGKWGMIDDMEQVVIEPTYDDIHQLDVVGFGEHQKVLWLTEVWRQPKSVPIGSGSIEIDRLYGIVNATDGREKIAPAMAHIWSYVPGMNPYYYPSLDTLGNWVFLSNRASYTSITYAGVWNESGFPIMLGGEMQLVREPKPEDISLNLLFQHSSYPINIISDTLNQRIEQDELFLRPVGGNWGMARDNGLLATKAEYEYVSDYMYGVALVKRKGEWGAINHKKKTYLPTSYAELAFLPQIIGGILFRDEEPVYGYVNRLGQWVISPVFTETGSISEGLIALNNGEHWGYVDTSGNEVLPFTYKEAGDFSQGLAPAKDKRYGYINPQGQWMIDPRYIRAAPFSEGYAVVKGSGIDGYINTSGELLEMNKAKQLGELQNGYATVRWKNKKYGILTADGNWALKPKWDKLELLAGTELVIVKKKKKYGLYDLQGNKIIKPKYKGIDHYGQGLVAVRSDEGWGYYNLNGDEVIEPAFIKLGAFSNGMAPAKERGEYGYIDEFGNWAIEPMFDEAESYKGGYAKVWLNDKCGLINERGDWVLPAEYDAIQPFENGLAMVSQNSEWMFVDEFGNNPYGKSWQAIQAFDDEGMALVKKKGLWGAINRQGQLVFDYRFYGIEPFVGNLAKVELTYPQGLMGTDKKEWIPNQYEHIKYLEGDILEVRSGNRIGYYNLNGSWIWECQE